MLARFEPDKRDEHAMEAARCFAELGWPFHRAVTLEIAEIPSEARRIYVNIGATAEAERLRGMRRPHRGRPTNRMSSLTPRQIDIVRFIAQGKSNSEIATLLDITRKTVGHHIGAIITNTDLRDRRELSTWAQNFIPYRP
jgi:DNA-binding CsgD family transcriptional regulator